MTDFSLGTYYQYMVADKTNRPGASSPVQDTSIPLFLGLGPETPSDTFTMGRHDYQVELVLEPSHAHNPFDVPLVMASRIRSQYTWPTKFHRS